MRDELKNSTYDRLTDALFYLFAVTTIIRSTPTSAGGVATNPAAAAGATGAAAVGTLRTANAATQLAAASGTVKAKKALPEIEMHFEPDRDSMVLPPASTVPVEFEATANDELPSAIDVHSDVKPIPEPANGMLFKEFNSEVLLHDICFFTLCCLGAVARFSVSLPKCLLRFAIHTIFNNADFRFAVGVR